ncbi:MAG: D-glycero-beta-D-manno-heptose 1-phosphate adenylyltransferase [Planctomycetes bacterium]|nr:D-glycero-beta-D-manno-heptose 1-phosphate adenylyltransferase [Planctomycetota bacterium]
MTFERDTPRLLRALEQLGSPHILVVGDLILDRYTWGNAERISQEAPVIVLRADHREARLGGAANVSCMLRGLGARVTIAGVVGRDEAGDTLCRMFDAESIERGLVKEDESRPTTVKERFMGRASARHPNQILRVDTELRDPLHARLEDEFVRGLQASVARHDAVLISDYGKGFCTPRLLHATIEACRSAGVPVLVDPARTDDFFQYRGATLLKPNRVEAGVATGCRIQRPEDAFRAGARLCEQLDLSTVIITLDRDGMALVPRRGAPRLYPTESRAVYDITGAGDLVLALLGICWASGVAPADAVPLCNVAGGLEVERSGVSKVSREEIRAELLARVQPGFQKLLTRDRLQSFGDHQRRMGRKVVFTNGCFDLLHVGHVTYLAEAAAFGDVLVVGVNSDASVRRLKGPSRPVISESDRAAMLAALACVEAVVIFDEDTPHRMLEALRPDVLVKGGTYAPSEVVGREIVEAYGGEVRVTSVVDGISTTQIVQSLVDQRSAKEVIPLSTVWKGRMRAAG